MLCLVVLLALAAPSNAQQTFDIVEGIGAQGWCNGFDMGPDESLAAPTTAAECFSNCKATHPTTVAVDWWPDRDPPVCWCQDTCDCLAASSPTGGNGVLYIEDGTDKGPSCGFNMYEIVENTAEDGWCRGSDIEMTDFTNQNDCFEKCSTQHGSVAVDYFNRDDGKVCFCQDECRCRSPSKEGGGDGWLLLAETETPPNDKCYTMTSGVGAEGWCNGFDMGPDENAPTPTTAAECYDNCKAAHDTTVAVDFWDINHPNRDAGNICWCQDACACTWPSKSDAGHGVLFVKAGTEKGPSCGYDMKTVVEGNDNSMCDGDATPATVQGGLMGCQAQCVTDGFSVATYFAYKAGQTDPDESECMCQMDCPCRKADDSRGYLFVEETMAMPQMCDSTMTCGEVKELYRDHSCCGMPDHTVSFR